MNYLKRNEIYRNEMKSMRNEINRNETKQYNIKWNKTYFNETISWGKTTQFFKNNPSKILYPFSDSCDQKYAPCQT
jgi:hypothetical protein